MEPQNLLNQINTELDDVKVVLDRFEGDDFVSSGGILPDEEETDNSGAYTPFQEEEGAGTGASVDLTTLGQPPDEEQEDLGMGGGWTLGGEMDADVLPSTNAPKAMIDVEGIGILSDSASGTLEEPAASLPRLADEVLVEAEKYVELGVKVNWLENNDRNSARAIRRLTAQEKIVLAVAEKAHEAAKAYNKALVAGLVSKSEAKSHRKKFITAGRKLWKIHESLSHDHGVGIDSQGMRKARTHIKRAKDLLK